MRDIVKDKQNKGQALPFDLQEQVADRMEASYDKFSEDFKQAYKKENVQGMADQVNILLKDGRRIVIPKNQEAKFRAKFADKIGG
jgi:hypothetical protein